MKLVLDETVALAVVDGDRKLLQRILAAFADETATQLEELIAALTQRDLGALQQVAGSLRRSAGVLGAIGVLRGARRLEQLCRRGDFLLIEAVCAVLEVEVEYLRAALPAVSYAAR